MSNGYDIGMDAGYVSDNYIQFRHLDALIFMWYLKKNKLVLARKMTFLAF